MCVCSITKELGIKHYTADRRTSKTHATDEPQPQPHSTVNATSTTTHRHSVWHDGEGPAAVVDGVEYGPTVAHVQDLVALCAAQWDVGE